MSEPSFGLALASGLSGAALGSAASSASSASSSGSVSAKDFEQFQMQLIQLKGDLYEAKERESRAQNALKKMAEDYHSLQQRCLGLDQQMQKSETSRVKAEKALAASKDAKKLTAFLQEHESYKVNLKSELDQQIEQNQALKVQLKDQFNRNQELLNELVAIKASMPSMAGGGSDSLQGEHIRAQQEEIGRLKGELETIREVYKEKEVKEQEDAKSMERIIARLSTKESEIVELRDEINRANENIRSLSQQLQAAEVKAKLLANLNLDQSAQGTQPGAAAAQQNAQDKDKPSSKADRAKDAIENRVNKLGTSVASFASSLRETFSSPKTKNNNNEQEMQQTAQAPAAAASAGSAAPSDYSSDIPSDASVDQSGWSEERKLAYRLDQELAQQRSVNDRLMESIQKKDAAIKKYHEDTERVLAKLTETELEVMKYREQSMQVDAALKDAKAKDAKLKKLESSEALNERSKQLQAELKVAHDSVQMLQNEFDQLKAQLEDTKDQLFLAETAANDAKKLIESRDDTIAELRATLDANEKTIARLCDQVDSQESHYNQLVQQWETKYNQETQQWEAKYSKEVGELRETSERVASELAVAQETLQARDALIDDLSISVKRLEIAESKQRSELEAANEKLEELSGQLIDRDTEAKIEAKKRNHIVEELKKQLKKETIRCKELEAQLRALRDELAAVREARKGSDSDLSIQLPLPSPSAAQSPVEAEVSNALASKLAACQDENFTLKKRLAGIEEECQLMRGDVQQKKEMIRHLIAQIDTGSLGTEEARADKTVQSELFQQLNEEERNKLFEKMEAVLQETTVQLIKLRESQGDENTKLSAALEAIKKEKFALEDELENVRIALEEVRDEKLISDQSAADSFKLVQNTQKELERVTKLMEEMKCKTSEEGTQIERIKSQFEGEKAQSQADKAELERQIREFTSEIQQIKAKLEETMRINKQQEAEIEHLKGKLTGASESGTAERVKMEEQISKLTRELEQAEYAAQQTKDKLAEAEQQSSQAKEKERQDQSIIAQLQEQLAQLRQIQTQAANPVPATDPAPAPSAVAPADPIVDLFSMASSGDSASAAGVEQPESAPSTVPVTSTSTSSSPDFLSDLLDNLQ